MQPEFIFRIVNDKWVWKHPNGKQLVKNFLHKYNNKKRWLKLTFKVVRQPKTLEQLGYYYTAVLPTVRHQLVEDGHTMTFMGTEIPIDKDETDKIIKHFCSRLAPDGSVRLYQENPRGEILEKRHMTKMQAMMFLNNCIFWAKETLGCEIPPPTYGGYSEGSG